VVYGLKPSSRWVNGLAISLATVVLTACAAGGQAASSPRSNAAAASGSASPTIDPFANDYPLPSDSPSQLGGPTAGSTYVPILMYHYIRINPDPHDLLGFNLSVTPHDFAVQMLYLQATGFHVVSLGTAIEAIRTHRSLPSRPVVLTFDDGYRDFYTVAAPVLQRLNFTATSFVVSGFLGRARYMTPQMVQILDAEGFTIGDHTVDHAALSSLPAARAAWEMSTARSALEGLIHHPVVDLAYPGGDFNPSVEQQVRQLGFQDALSTLPGPYHTDSTLYALTRQRVSGGISMGYYAQLTGGPAPTAAWLQWANGAAGPVLAGSGHWVGRFL
jgi:peptidoglycan/xylan/chitin deacetylase (PgdA/CDA1 family)